MGHEEKYDRTLDFADIVSLTCNCFLNVENLKILCKARAVSPNYISQLMQNFGNEGNEPRNIPTSN